MYKMISDPKFAKEMDEPYKVDRAHDVPYVAGYSKDHARTIYIDRHYKKMMGGVDTEPYVFVHEKVEKSLIDVFGLHYQEAHKIAEHFERMIVEKDGLDWSRYEKFVMDQYKHIYKENLEKLPKHLDLTPYKDEKEFKVLKAMHDEQHRNKASRGTRST
jgi:hypothetical protein